MKISESRLSGLYFFLVFLAMVVGFSLYKSFYAVVSPKYLQEVLRNRLAEEVTLYDMKLEEVDFNFFHGFFFKPGLAWKGFHISYSKNCNYIEASSPDIYFAVDLTRLFRRKLDLEEVITSQLDLKIIKDYACPDRNAEEEEAQKPVIAMSSSASPLLQTAPPGEILLVKNLPDFRVSHLRLFTERNLRRYLEFKNLVITHTGVGYNYQSDLSFSPALNVGTMPSLKINGSFDSNHNIQISSRLREASMDFKVEPLGDKNFRTTFSVSDFPLQYVVNMLKDKYPELSSLNALGSQWINLSTHTVSHWNDFFDKNLILYVENLQISGDMIKLKSQPFQYNLKEEKLVTGTKLKVENVVLAPLMPLLFSTEMQALLLQPGSIAGDLEVTKDLKLQFDGTWSGASFFVEAYGIKKTLDVLPTKVEFEKNQNTTFFTTNNLALRNVGGELSLSVLEEEEKTTAKVSAKNMVANEIWTKLFNANIDYLDLNIEVLQDVALRWKGKADYRGLSGQQFSGERGSLQFERGTSTDSISITHQNVEVKESSILQDWISEMYQTRIKPKTLRHWKSTEVKNLKSEIVSYDIDFLGESPNFQLRLQQINENEFSVSRASPPIHKSKVQKAGASLF